MENSWTEACYQTLHFFFWEPQHLGKRKNPDTTYNTPQKVSEHVRNMEVTLNHSITTYLLLAPPSFRTRLFKRCFGSCPSGEIQMHDQDIADDLDVPIQPDFCFRSKSSVVSLEMKINAKSSINQFLKYLLLGLADEMSSKHKKEHYLGFIGTDSFSSLWKSEYKSPAELKKAAESELAVFLSEKGDHFVKHLPRFHEILSSVNVGFVTYRDIAKILIKSRPPTSDESEGAGVYRRLIQGLLSDLKVRKLI